LVAAIMFASVIAITVFQRPKIARLAARTLPVSTTPPIIADFAPLFALTLDVRADRFAGEADMVLFCPLTHSAQVLSFHLSLNRNHSTTSRYYRNRIRRLKLLARLCGLF
jgi:hypothetical protein